MYSTMKHMLEEGKKQGIGIGAFNIHALEVVPVMIQAAVEEKVPIIMQTSVSTAKYIGFDLLAAIVKKIAQKKDIEIAMHLDHAKELSDIQAALDGGFSSVMFDGSHLPLEENISMTCKAVELAKKAGASIEAELGIVGRGKTITKYPYTDAEDARIFVERTGVDALAVGIGTHHGQYQAKTEINLEALANIHEAVEIPLVLHGGTGVKEEDICKCIALGMHKLNFGTELNVGWVKKAKETFAQAELDDSLRELLIVCNDEMKSIIQRKLRLLR